jgi:hypothetical protein
MSWLTRLPYKWNRLRVVEIFASLGAMSWWADKSRSAVTVVEAAPPVDRFAQAQSHMRSLKAQLDSLDAAMLLFKKTHRVTTDRYSRLLGIQSPTLTGRAVIETQWQALLTRRDALVPQWHQALHQWSDLKLSAGEKNATT